MCKDAIGSNKNRNMAVFSNGLFIRFLLITMILSSRGTEPQCSKFPYEEALLEKMIRMEFEVQQMREGINKVKEQVADELSSLKETSQKLFDEVKEKVGGELNKLKETRSEVKDISENMSQDWKDTKTQLDVKMKQLEVNVSIDKAETLNDINAVQEQNEAKLMRMSEDLVALRNETIKSVQENLLVPNVQFVSRVTKQLTFSNAQTIIFDTILSNEGNGYNERTGVFTAPSTGNYIFTTQVCGLKGIHIEFSFFVNDIDTQRGYTYGPNSDPCWSYAMIRRCEIGDRVSVKSVGGSNTLVSNVYHWNLFSGVLVSK